jgi:ribonuclease HI
VARTRTHRFISPAEGALTVFTDGSSFSGPRRGGIGIRFVYCDRRGNEEVFDAVENGFAGATNNQMELMAVVTAMRQIQGRHFPPELREPASRIEIYTDSQYVADNVNNACFAWPDNDWLTRDGAPVQNAEQWKEFPREYVKLRRLKPVRIQWGKGHSADNPHNKAVDKLAKESAGRPLNPPLTRGSVRRKKTIKQTDRGSVEMRGQRMTIRIVEAAYLRVQRLHRYRYEVTSRRNPFFGNVDIAHSEDGSMRPGHVYHVTMNEDSRDPRIVKCHFEVKEGARS